ncbi:unnamed protein product [Brassica napus]|uniref:(rape) hypothetical protein n=1 Tax=Brassica napus TaxID=3708 RepID=A0A816Z4J1_BRANA|nr:unnamed protein product [Brassica napus]
MGRHDSSSEEDERVRRSERERGRRGSSTRVTADMPSDDRQKSRRESERKQDGLLKRDRRERDWSGSQRDKLRKEEKSEVAKPKLPELNPSDSNAIALGKTGGVYIPPFKLARMMKEMASPGFTDVFAALVAVINAKFPEVAELLLKRVVLQLKRAYKRNDKPQLLAAVKFIAHLVNQQVAEEIIALELVSVLLETPTDDSVEVAVGFVTECGAMLQDVTPKGLHGIFERFRGILHEGDIDKRVQYLIEGLFAIRKAKFQGHPAVRPELDLVEDKYSHDVSLNDEIDPDTSLDVFKPDPDFNENEKKYEALKKELLGEDESEDEDGSDASSEEDGSDEEEDEEEMRIRDETETNLLVTSYFKIKLEPGQEMELCIMLLECYLSAVLRFVGSAFLTVLLIWLLLCIWLQKLSEHLGIRLLNERL